MVADGEYQVGFSDVLTIEGQFRVLSFGVATKESAESFPILLSMGTSAAIAVYLCLLPSSSPLRHVVLGAFTEEATAAQKEAMLNGGTVRASRCVCTTK